MRFPDFPFRAFSGECAVSGGAEVPFSGECAVRGVVAGSAGEQGADFGVQGL